jgi:hypothetical protein
VLPELHGLRLVGLDDERKNVLHAAGLLLHASDALHLVQKKTELHDLSKEAPQLNDTWLD